MHGASLRSPRCERHRKSPERDWSQRVRPRPTLIHKIGGEIVDFTRLEALGAKDIVCRHCFLQIVEIVRECLTGSRPGCLNASRKELRKVFEGGSP
jgi:hypothetical protein